MKIKIKYLASYKTRNLGDIKRATEGSSGFDLFCCEKETLILYPNQIVILSTGIILEIPKGYEGQIRSRSGLACHGIFVANSPGTVDSDYRGEVKVILTSVSAFPYSINPKDKIAQIVFVKLPKVKLITVEEISETKRGEGGFGSTGK